MGVVRKVGVEEAEVWDAAGEKAEENSAKETEE